MPQQPELLVEDGFYAGLRAPLEHGSSTVGSDLDSAVVIDDPALRPGHFEIHYNGGRTALRAVGGDVVLADGTALSPGQDLVLAQPISFTAGSTRFALAPPALLQGPAEAFPAGVPPTRHVPVAAGILATVAVAIIGISMAGLRGGHAPHTGLPQIVHIARDAAPSAPVEAIAQGLRDRLDLAGLSALAVAPAKDGSVVVQGVLFPTQMAAWGGVRQWYDTEYGNDHVLVNQVMPAGSGPELAVAAVWAGSNPYIVDDHGNKMFVGAAVNGGWTIQSIESEHVVLQNGVQKVSVRY